VIVLAVEAAAGTLGDWIDDRIQGLHAMREVPWDNDR
jgi:hypothetical protein